MPAAFTVRYPAVQEEGETEVSMALWDSYPEPTPVGSCWAVDVSKERIWIEIT